jgi:glycosyltransferase involved in cell wall biosynthesis
MSEFSRAKHREFGFEREMEVLPYFLPDPEGRMAPEPSTSPHPRPYFFFAGRLEFIKGLDDVIPVFRQFPDADLLIAGDGEHGRRLQALAAGLPNVKFLGRLPSEALDAYYRHAVASLVPSVCFETFGIVVIEAFRQGTPVIARRLGPLPEIVTAADGGELFETPAELVAAMRRLLRDPAHRARLASSGYQAYVSRWSESAVIPRYLDIVRRAAVRRGHRRVLNTLAPVEVA